MKLLENKMIRQTLGVAAGLYVVGARASLIKLLVGASIGLYAVDRFRAVSPSVKTLTPNDTERDAAKATGT